MKSSRLRKSRRPFLDINFRRDSRLIKRWFLGWEDKVVDLKPTFFRKYKIRWVLAIFLAVFLVFAVNKLFTRAEVTDFYPQTCLGTWQNPINSQGEPENFNLASSSFSDSNSAVFTSGSDKIFCGKFLADDYQAEGNIKNVGLTLVWNIEGVVSSQLAPVNGENNTNMATSSESVNASTSTSYNDGLFLSSFIQRAFAEELSSTPAILEQVPPPVDSSSIPVTNSEIPAPTSSIEVSSTAKEEPKPADTNLTVPSPTGENTISDSTGNVSSSNSGVEESSTSTPVIVPPAPDNNFLKVSYSFDGQNWFELSRVSGDNWKNLTINLPNVTWDEIRSLQISVEGTPTALEKLPKVFLDGMFLEVQYDVPPIINLNLETKKETPSLDKSDENRKELPVIVLPDDKKPRPAEAQSEDFTPSESPRFDFDLNNLPESASGAQGTSPPISQLNIEEKGLSSTNIKDATDISNKNSKNILTVFLNFFGFGGKAKAQESLSVGGGVVSAQNPVVGQVIDPSNKKTNIQPLFLTVNNKLRISIPEPERDFKPGRYRLNLWIYKNGIVYFTSNDFTWGVLAVNFNKSIFTKGDKVKIGVGVLTDMGHTICDAGVDLKVTDPNGNFYLFSTRDGSVVRSETCGPETVTNEPDYLAEIKARIIGTYSVLVTARTANGTRSIEDKFEVQTEPIFDVERQAPTRIFPPSNYKVTLRVKANQDFKGIATESMPTSFTLITERISTEEVLGNDRVVRWNLDLKKGESQDLVYFFKAPDVSPELYKLGPLSFTSGAASGGGSLVFEEARQWQIAADAAGEIILLWEGATIPSGWTCISCAATDPFFNVFPRASSTYGSASSSQDKWGHTLTFSSYVIQPDSLLVSVPNDVSPAEYPASNHTHTWGNALASSTDIRPPYYKLKFIKAATTTLPNGIIGIFAVASSSLPTGWGRYTPMAADRYLYGGSATSTGGATVHNHVNTTAIVSGAANNILDDTGTGVLVGGISHTHTIATSTSASVGDAANNRPPFIGVVFGQIKATTTLGSGTDGLIAMFDNASLPTDWVATSSASSPFSGRFLSASTTFGGTGGSATHNHNNSMTFTSGGSASLNVIETLTSPTSTYDNTHTHDVTYTVETTSSLPVYRDVILGQYTAPPVPLGVSNVVLNAGNAIVLFPNITTTISIVASTTGSNFNYATGTIARSSTTLSCAANNLNCYQIPSSSCIFSGSSSSTVTCSADIYYFAQATDASSSFNGQKWLGQITLTDTTPTSTSSSTATGVVLNNLLAINVTTSSIQYGSIAPSSTTGLANQTVSVQNVGNVSSSIGVKGTAMTFGSYIIGTSTQRYASSTFNFGGGEGILSDTNTTISGITIKQRISLVNDLGAWAVNANILPYVVYQHAAATYNGYIYVLGGQATSTVIYAPINSNGSVGSWSYTTAMPALRYQFPAIAYNGYLYAIAGQVAGGVATSSVIYAPINSNGTIGSWAEAGSMPYTIFQHQSAVKNGYIYNSGGDNDVISGTSTVSYAPINSDGTLGSWAITTALPTILFDHGMVVSGDYIYTTGGFTDTLGSITSTVFYAPINLNRTVGSWTPTTVLPSKITNHRMAVNNDYIYVVSGKITSAGSPTSTVKYAPINSNGTVGSWTDTTVLPGLIADGNATAYNGYLYNLGGSDLVNFVTTSTVFYAPINNGNSQKDTFWGAGPQAVGAAPTGTYSGVNTFTASFVP